MSQARRFCFTTYGEEAPLWDDSFYSYLLYQREICPTTGNLHWQCYCETITKRTFESVRKRLRKQYPEKDKISVHLEICHGSAEKNYKYCTKPESAIEGTRKEFGELMKQGDRTDIVAFMQRARTATDLELMDEFPSQFARMPNLPARVRAAVLQHYATRKREDLKVIWLWGPPGTGKSYKADEMGASDPRGYYASPSPIWYDGYNGEGTLILEDLAPGEIQRNIMLRVTDKLPYKLPIKGSFIQAAYTTVIITSNYPPEAFGMEPLMRRITHIEHMTIPYGQELTITQTNIRRLSLPQAGQP